MGASVKTYLKCKKANLALEIRKLKLPKAFTSVSVSAEEDIIVFSMELSDITILLKP